VAAGVSDAAQADLRTKVRSLAALADGRVSIQVSADAEPQVLLAELASRGASVESLNPIRATLEDYFLHQVKSAEQRHTEGL
jgi:hypothetical protein